MTDPVSPAPAASVTPLQAIVAEMRLTTIEQNLIWADQIEAVGAAPLADALLRYDAMLRNYKGPQSALYAGDEKVIDAAYDNLISMARAAVAAAQAGEQKPVAWETIEDARKLFERVHCGGNKEFARRNTTTGDYVVASCADAWSGWWSALSSGYASPVAQGWQPIATAPMQDDVLIYIGSGVVCEGYQDADGHGWFLANTHWTDATDSQVFPEAWMPLPEPPR